jgi:hypothetical protein
MKVFTCSRCGSDFSAKGSLKNHLKKKAMCNSDILDVSQKQCLDFIDNKDIEVKSLQEQVRKLKSQLSKNVGNYMNVSGDHANVSNSNNSVNFYINLQVNSFQDTDYSCLKGYINKCLDQSKEYFPNIEDMVKKIHFNKEKPENHNVYKPNAREDKYLIYDKDTNSFLLDRGADAVITSKIENILKDVMKERKTKFENHFKGDSEHLQSVKQGVRDTLYNGKEITKETHKKKNKS